MEWKEIYHILFEDTPLSNSAHLALFCRSFTRQKLRAGNAGVPRFVRKIASKWHEKSHVLTGVYFVEAVVVELDDIQHELQHFPGTLRVHTPQGREGEGKRLETGKSR